jgi:hypothetical protein
LAAHAASQLLAPVAALALLAVALDGFIAFAAYGRTEGGFTAGLALALSFCFDPGALLYAAVLAFPVAAVFTGWLFLVWKFSGSLLGSLHYQAGALWLGFAYSQVTAYLMFTLLALVTIASLPSRRLQPAFAVAALCQVALAIAWPPVSPGYNAWLHALF